MDRFSGYYSNDLVTYEKVLVSKRFIARTAISEFFETALSAQLYTLEVINEGEEFTAELTGLTEDLFNSLKSHFDDIALRIGLGKSRGLGEVSIRVRRTRENAGYSIHNRSEQINNSMKNFISNKNFFSITLLSDVILLDETLRFKSIIEITDLIDSIPDITGEDRGILNKFKLLRGVLSTHIVSGWNHALKLPQEDSLSIAKGSVFLFISDMVSEGDKEKLVIIFDKIEKTGIGEQKNKGFGRVRFYDEFHWEVPLK